jgi:hypothetical protein
MLKAMIKLNKRNLLLNTDNSMKHLDTNFFKNSVGDAHIVQTSKDARNKSKSIDKKHGNKNKHEKLRRIYENMDA